MERQGRANLWSGDIARPPPPEERGTSKLISDLNDFHLAERREKKRCTQPKIGRLVGPVHAHPATAERDLSLSAPMYQRSYLGGAWTLCHPHSDCPTSPEPTHQVPL